MTVWDRHQSSDQAFRNRRQDVESALVDSPEGHTTVRSTLQVKNTVPDYMKCPYQSAFQSRIRPEIKK